MSYVYILIHIPTNKQYVGVRYAKKCSPNDLLKTYNTSSKYVKKHKKDFIIKKIKLTKNAVNLERRYLRFLYFKLGKEHFCEQYINRNLAPGIIHDQNEKKKISDRMKLLWKTEKRQIKHKITIENNKNNGIYENRKGKTFITDKGRKILSNKMVNHNPMKNSLIKEKHKQIMNSEIMKKKRSILAKGNTNCKNKHWYNNGVITKMFYEPPNTTWILGRLNPSWNTNRKLK